MWLFSTYSNFIAVIGAIGDIRKEAKPKEKKKWLRLMQTTGYTKKELEQFGIRCSNHQFAAARKMKEENSKENFKSIIPQSIQKKIDNFWNENSRATGQCLKGGEEKRIRIYSFARGFKIFQETNEDSISLSSFKKYTPKNYKR
jgi:hypothetical protein